MTMTATTPDGAQVRIVGCEEGEIAYTNEFIGTVNVTRLKARIAADALSPVTIGMEPDNILAMLKQQDIDMARVNELLTGPRERLYEPLIHLHMPDGSQILLDGTHRVAALYIMFSKNDVIMSKSHLLKMSYVKPFHVRFFIKPPGKPEREMGPMEVLAPTWGLYTDTSGRKRQ